MRDAVDSLPEKWSCVSADMLYAVPSRALMGQSHKKMNREPSSDKQIFSWCWSLRILHSVPLPTPQALSQAASWNTLIESRTQKQLYFVTFDIAGPEG